MEPDFGTGLWLHYKNTLLHYATRLALGARCIFLRFCFIFCFVSDGYGQRVDRERLLLSDPPSFGILAIPSVCCFRSSRLDSPLLLRHGAVINLASDYDRASLFFYYIFLWVAQA